MPAGRECAHPPRRCQAGEAWRIRPEDIEQTCLHVQDGGTTVPLPVSETFGQALVGRR